MRRHEKIVPTAAACLQAYGWTPPASKPHATRRGGWLKRSFSAAEAKGNDVRSRLLLEGSDVDHAVDDTLEGALIARQLGGERVAAFVEGRTAGQQRQRLRR